jgi:hypothetical protein
MKLGLIQGRLMRPEDGWIQEFPTCWVDEFIKAKTLGFGHIEWIVTERSFETNPIFFEDCKDYNISSICADNLVSEKIIDEEFLFHNLDPICRSAIKNKINWVTIPLLEGSSISDKKIRDIFIPMILKYSDKYPSLNFSFEAETQAENILELVSLRDNFWITYDTGNITSEKIDHKDYILKTYHKINNVHLKDRTFNAETVPPLSGDTDFDTIFNTLTSVGYDNLYTIQTARGKTGTEIRTMKQHKNIFERLYYASYT